MGAVGVGYANSYYSAAVQAGSQSWTAFLFGSLDAGNAITVDKPPASLWLMALSVRIFGLSSWSILVPQALLGVATVAVLYASVRRTVAWSLALGGLDARDRALAGLVAGAVLALTPVAALMFRFNNPDALLVFLLTAPRYCTLRASERASGKWLVGAGVLVGFAFLTKMLQAFVVLPALALVYLVVAPTSLRRRILHLLARPGRHDHLARLVGGARRAGAGVLAALRRRFGEQLGAGADLRLQRTGPDLRQRRWAAGGSFAAAGCSKASPADDQPG